MFSVTQWVQNKEFFTSREILAFCILDFIFLRIKALDWKGFQDFKLYHLFCKMPLQGKPARYPFC